MRKPYSGKQVDTVLRGVEKSKWLEFRGLCAAKGLRQNAVLKSLVVTWVAENKRRERMEA